MAMSYNKLSSYMTRWSIDSDDKGSVTYQNTMIVEWDAYTIKLRSGGWETVTTKRKMNQASRQFNLGYSVYQRKGIWYVDTPDGETFKFYDGIMLARRKSHDTICV